MTHDRHPRSDLRTRAIARARLQEHADPSSHDVETLQHELQLHQIELELQNEELRRGGVAREELSARYLDLYDRAPVGYCTVDAHGLIVEANQTLASLVGMARDGLLSTPFHRYVLPVDQDVLYRLRRPPRPTSIADDGERPDRARTCELRMMGLARATIWVQLAATVDRPGGVDADEGEPPALRITVTDISELRASRARQRLALSVLAHVSQGVLITDPDGTIISANSAFVELAGYAEDELRGRNPRLLQGADTDPAEVAAIGEALAARAEYAGELLLYRRDGAPFWSALTISPVFDGEGVLSHFVAVMRDVTSAKHEAADRAQRDRVALQGEKLQAIGTLAAGIAHDFNTCLTAILGHAELALATGAATTEGITDIRVAALRARELVNQVLDFSRRRESTRHTLALGPLITEAARFLRAILPTTIEIVTTTQADAPRVLADRGQLHQVLVNLCTNAWHAFDGRPGRIEVGLRRVTDDDQEVGAEGEPFAPGVFACVSVRDNGTGIAPDTLRRMFEPFFTTKPAGQGTGLGLSVVHGIVTSHGGVIRVDSALAQGTTFRVYLPAIPTDAAAEAAEVRPPPAPTPAMARVVANAPRFHILHVEDEELLRQMSVRMMELLGYDVTSFAEPAAAVRAFRAQPDRYDLVVTDLNMPGTSGLVVARELRAIRPDLRVVLTSGVITSELQHEAAQIGIYATLPKPFTIVEGKEVLARACPPR